MSSDSPIASMLNKLPPGYHINYDVLSKNGQRNGFDHFLFEYLKKNGFTTTTNSFKCIAGLDYVDGYLEEVPGKGCLDALWNEFWQDSDNTQNLLYWYVWEFLMKSDQYKTLTGEYVMESAEVAENPYPEDIQITEPNGFLYTWWSYIIDSDE